jgi:hypothetical protein
LGADDGNRPAFGCLSGGYTSKLHHLTNALEINRAIASDAMKSLTAPRSWFILKLQDALSKSSKNRNTDNRDVG